MAAERPPVFRDPEAYPAIVVHQPDAALIELGWKTIETRKRPLHQRGKLVICAGKANNPLRMSAVRYEVIRRGLDVRLFDDAIAHRGTLSALVELHLCSPLIAADREAAWIFAPDRYGWHVRLVKALRHEPVVGGQGFFRVPRTIIDGAMRQHGEAT